jgi:hypothetical protein
LYGCLPGGGERVRITIIAHNYDRWYADAIWCN